MGVNINLWLHCQRNQPGGWSLWKKHNRSTEPQTENQLCVWCSLVIMPCSLLLNTLLSHLLQPTSPLFMDVLLHAIPHCLCRTRKPHRLSTNPVWCCKRNNCYFGEMSDLSTFAPRTTVEAWWTRQMELMPQIPSAHSPFIHPLELEKHVTKAAFTGLVL